MNILATVLCGLEMFHFVSHVFIMCGWRMLPRKDLVRQRPYFLVDCLSVAIASYVVTGQFLWLAAIQNVQHLFYFITWEKSTAAKKVVSWSSLDWHHSRLNFNLVTGTMFDVIVHAVFTCCLCCLLSTAEIVAALITVNGFLAVTLANPRFAWASPSNIPTWVNKRIQPLPEGSY